MARTTWLRERRVEAFGDALGRLEGKRSSAMDSERDYIKAKVQAHERPDGALAVFRGPDASPDTGATVNRSQTQSRMAA